MEKLPPQECVSKMTKLFQSIIGDISPFVSKFFLIIIFLLTFFWFFWSFFWLPFLLFFISLFFYFFFVLIILYFRKQSSLLSSEEAIIFSDCLVRLGNYLRFSYSSSVAGETVVVSPSAEFIINVFLWFFSGFLDLISIISIVSLFAKTNIFFSFIKLFTFIFFNYLPVISF